MSASLIEQSLARRYARALFDLAAAEKAVESTAEALKNLMTLAEESKTVHHFMHHPAVPTAMQQSGLAAIAEPLKLSPLMRRFLGVLAENRRLSLLGSITDAFQAFVAKQENRVPVVVTSAEPVTKTFLKEIETTAQEITKQPVDVRHRVDESILGGLMVQIGSRMVDDSLRSHLTTLRRQLTQSGDALADTLS